MQIDAILEAARVVVAANTWCFAVTLAADGTPHARLIQPGRLQPDWSLSFLSDARSRKVQELRRDPRLTLAWQHDAERAYVTLLGRAAVNVDVVAKRAIWRPEMNHFHPGGPDDPNNVIIEFATERLEIYSGARSIAPPPRGFSAAMLTRKDGGWSLGASFPA
jgi:general stress protein 26